MVASGRRFESHREGLGVGGQLKLLALWSDRQLAQAQPVSQLADKEPGKLPRVLAFHETRLVTPWSANVRPRQQLAHIIGPAYRIRVAAQKKRGPEGGRGAVL